MSDIQSLQPERTGLLMRALEIVLTERKVGFGEIIRALGDPDTYPEHLLHWPAWERSVEVWDHSWPADVKRAVIKRSIAVHRWKGTRWAVEEALAAIGFEAEIREWFEFGGTRVPGSLAHLRSHLILARSKSRQRTLPQR
ncbi:phage tail protein I (plasmid) [Phaeobacter inhibens]|uniref:phage tail protein I n=1 Tax=Phaeobacter inhibens TaxID=221822 RepID=UPI0009718AD0|nr:phage tail protein I [Phaeobacter inhibens]APX17813.1 phage tail protein I [Phaeobacter inhibens]